MNEFVSTVLTLPKADAALTVSLVDMTTALADRDIGVFPVAMFLKVLVTLLIGGTFERTELSKNAIIAAIGTPNQLIVDFKKNSGKCRDTACRFRWL